MDIEAHIRAVMSDGDKALTVSQVAVALSGQIEDDVRLALNAMVKSGEVESVHGGGGFQTYYHRAALPLRI